MHRIITKTSLKQEPLPVKYKSDNKANLCIKACATALVRHSLVQVISRRNGTHEYTTQTLHLHCLHKIWLCKTRKKIPTYISGCYRSQIQLFVVVSRQLLHPTSMCMTFYLWGTIKQKSLQIKSLHKELKENVQRKYNSNS
jgi:hypothetical protein